MAFVAPMVNAFGGRWFDMDWNPQLTSEPWKKAVNYYVENMNAYGPPGAAANGHNESRALFATGKCAIWVDATSAAGYIYNPNESQVADKTAFAAAPVQETDAGSGWFWSWALGISSSSSKVDTAKSFLQWATSKSTYENAAYLEAAPFAEVVYNSVSNADITKSTTEPVPYVGIQYVAIPEFQGIGTQVDQSIAAALSGQMSVEEALENAQAATERTMKQAGYMQ